MDGRLSLSESKFDSYLCPKRNLGNCGIGALFGVNGIACDSQGKKKRQHGTEAVKSHILAAKTVANIVKSSLVWSGMKSGSWG